MNQYASKHRGGGSSKPVEKLDDVLLGKINFSNPDAALFDETAEQIARSISECGREMNKSTQLRRFYDEVITWHTKVQQNPADFEKFLPFIRMINAKVSYAEGRKLVDTKFSSLMRDCLRKVVDVPSFNNFKLFFEAFLGFYKVHKPK